MSVRAFLDTNIIIYSYSQDELEKQQCARACVQNKDVWISTQVLNETINTLRRKFSLSYVQIRAVVDELTQQFQIALVRIETIQMALAIADRYQYSYFDSLIIASALEMQCNRLYSEDMSDGQLIESQLTITNPFTTLRIP